MSDQEVPTPGKQPTTPTDLHDEVPTEGNQPTRPTNLEDEVPTEGVQPATRPTDEEISGNPGNPVEE